jgi:broad-specificity NMP kinase
MGRMGGGIGTVIGGVGGFGKVPAAARISAVLRWRCVSESTVTTRLKTVTKYPENYHNVSWDRHKASLNRHKNADRGHRDVLIRSRAAILFSYSGPRGDQAAASTIS